MNNTTLQTDLPQDWTAAEQSRWVEMAEQVQQYKNEGKSVVLVTGVFDIFHDEHKNFLKQAQAVGDVLVVGVESDARVRALKGEGRPVDAQDIRTQRLRELEGVKIAEILPENFSRPEHHRAFIGLLRPDFLAVSSHSPYQDKKQAILEEFGGTLRVVHEHNPAISTTKILADRTE